MPEPLPPPSALPWYLLDANLKRLRLIQEVQEFLPEVETALRLARRAGAPPAECAELEQAYRQLHEAAGQLRGGDYGVPDPRPFAERLAVLQDRLARLRAGEAVRRLC